MVMLIEDTTLTAAAAQVQCYCREGKTHEVIFPTTKFICPDCGSELYIDWHLEVSVDMITPSDEYTRRIMAYVDEGLQNRYPWGYIGGQDEP